MEHPRGGFGKVAENASTAEYEMDASGKNIFERDLAGEVISLLDPEYDLLLSTIMQAQQILAELNHGYHEPSEIRRLFANLTGVEVDSSFNLFAPFYTDFGRNIRVGKGVFINHDCEFMDRGGITIGDGALIGPKVNLITINHPEDPEQRHSTWSAPITIGKNVWICVATTILPGVTIGDNSIVAAHAVVSRSVPPNSLVAGVPAKVIRPIRRGETPRKDLCLNEVEAETQEA